MKHIRKFNENALGSWKFSDIRKLYAKSQGLGRSGKEVSDSFDETFPNSEHDDEKVLIQEDLGIELMEVIRPYYEKYGIDEVKKYLSEFLDDFENETYINDYFNSPN